VSGSALSLVVHGHFYQPPRENPWTGVVEPEPSAAPDRDWNTRITRECYAPLAALPAADGAHTLSAYEWLSFDAGPTLLAWLDRAAPAVVDAMRAADRASARRLGHGNAIASPYHHDILPLLSRRDKRTEVRWGLADFRRRFGRDSAGFWLPETAVDTETLEVLAEEGVAFTIVAPYQLNPAPADGLAGRVALSGGRSIALFAFDGELSHGVAFGPLVNDAAAWERAMLARRPAGLTSVAVDGETFGHHHKPGARAVGTLSAHLAAREGVRLENYASVLAAHPAAHAVTLVEPSAWSCAHGVGRWSRECGCRIEPDTQQRWRAPLLAAIEWLTAEIHALYERDGRALPGGPWAFRDAAQAVGPVAQGQPLVDMERSVLAAHTSCGWFFDDFGKLEGRQVLRFAAYAIALAGGEAPRLEAGLLERLAPAVSNDPAVGTARDFYLQRIKPERPA